MSLPSPLLVHLVEMIAKAAFHRHCGLHFVYSLLRELLIPGLGTFTFRPHLLLQLLDLLLKADNRIFAVLELEFDVRVLEKHDP